LLKNLVLSKRARVGSEGHLADEIGDASDKREKVEKVLGRTGGGGGGEVLGMRKVGSLGRMPLGMQVRGRSDGPVSGRNIKKEIIKIGTVPGGVSCGLRLALNDRVRGDKRDGGAKGNRDFAFKSLQVVRGGEGFSVIHISTGLFRKK